MAEKPIVGEHGEPPEESPEESVEGTLLYDPTPRPPLDEEGAPLPEKSKGRLGIILVVAVLGIAAAGYVGYQRRTGEAPYYGDRTPDVPTMVTSVTGGVDETEALLPVPQYEVDGVVGQAVPIGFRARGAGGVALVDTLVRLRVESGDGLLQSESARTDRDGVARTSILLPMRPGSSMIVAELDGSSMPEARMIVSSLPGPPDRIRATAGDGQVAEVGELLPIRPSVVIVDAVGNPVAGAWVEFEVVSGEGVRAPSRGRTDSLGQVTALWRLGFAEGVQQLSASSPALAGRVMFTARATARTAPPSGTDGTGPGPETGPVTVVRSAYSVGGSHVCRLSGGVASCRGGNDRGQTDTGSRGGFAAITTGVSHSCALDLEGTASCWGANHGGQLGDGARADRRGAPFPIRTELRFSSLTAGAAHTCGIAGGGVPLCWGQNANGQLGDGTRNDHLVPRTVGGGVSFRSLVAGWDHTCGLTANGNAFCWGLNSQGQLGDGSRLDRLQPNIVRGAVQTLVAGSAHTCGISEAQVVCWGSNSRGQLGDRTTEDRSQPVVVQGLPSAPTRLAAGAVHTCALVAGGQAYCWGQNLAGQLGDGSTQNRSTAVPVSGDLTFSQIHAGGALTCGLTTDGAEYCWGLNQSGQLGDGSRQSRATPTRVGG